MIQVWASACSTRWPERLDLQRGRFHPERLVHRPGAGNKSSDPISRIGRSEALLVANWIARLKDFWASGALYANTVPLPLSPP